MFKMSPSNPLILKYLKKVSSYNNLCKTNPTMDFDDDSVSVYRRYYSINISDNKFGNHTVSQGSKPPYTYSTRLTLIHGGLDVDTASMEGLWKRYQHACELLEGYGIVLDNNIPLVPYTMEFSITFVCDDVLPLRTRKYIINSFSEGHYASDSKHYTGTSTPTDKHTAHSQCQ
ncbi:hypothetical protein [Hespellia stercorisuis]|uniref:Uncharacterized protein n=1 Tax=Hespellia stercorisuis DSM 15480 TaxID=1121950 RepID=A0A1M6RY53_9FIRM|nr:hypothetical protein [Hespellia stercorisuis]SHK37406.1 hypothetical protein SAMN02745243_02803 [Hespellia stercorisuis DSM 15480]